MGASRMSREKYSHIRKEMKKENMKKIRQRYENVALLDVIVIVKCVPFVISITFLVPSSHAVA